MSEGVPPAGKPPENEGDGWKQAAPPDEEPGPEGAGGWLTEFLRLSGPTMGAAYTLTGALLGLGFLGYLLDLWLGSGPWLLLLGLAAGLVVGFYELGKAMFRGPGGS